MESNNVSSTAKQRVLLIANKRWEADPLMGVLLEKKARSQVGFKWPGILNILQPPAKGETPDIKPRAIFDYGKAEIEFWCIEDLMDRSNIKITTSNTKEKDRVLKELFKYQGKGVPDFVIAFGTAAFPRETSVNGCVVVGTNVFIHDPMMRADDPDNLFWHDESEPPRIDKLLSSKIEDRFFNPEIGAITETLRAETEHRFLKPPFRPSDNQVLLAARNYTAVGSVNIIFSYDDYAWADPEALEAFQDKGRDSRGKLPL